VLGLSFSLRSEIIIFQLKGERFYSLITIALIHYLIQHNQETAIYSPPPPASETELKMSDVELRGFYYNNRDYYWGYCLRGHNIPYGLGITTSPGKFVHEGNYKNGLYHGFGKITWELSYQSTGIPIKSYEGGFRDGFFHGEGTATYYVSTAAGTLSQGSVIRYIGGWSWGRKNGYGSFSDFKGTEYKGGWKDNVLHGHGIFTWANGCYYDGGWKYGKKSGFGIFVYGDGSRYEGGWLDDNKHGYGISVPPVAYVVYN
jgi:1-phosphatidylinositol-4-phosphate 5-kinase